MNDRLLFTIGHSNRTFKEFVTLLDEFEISAIADVRSHPFSRMNPQFNREELAESLKSSGIAYVFLGAELGARRNERSCYVDGVARYERIVETELFKTGLDRIRHGSSTHRIAMMCAEKDPLTCHRTILISRALRDEFSIKHIVAHDQAEGQAQADDRLLRLFNLDNRTLFESREHLLDDAYERQAERIAYREPLATPSKD